MPTFNLQQQVNPRRVQQLEAEVASLKRDLAALKQALARMEQDRAKEKRQEQYTQSQLTSLTATVNSMMGRE